MLGYVLKLVRTYRDMSLKEVAQKSGISATTISGIENENKYPIAYQIITRAYMKLKKYQNHKMTFEEKCTKFF